MNKNNIHALSRAVVIDQNYILLCQTLDLLHNFYFLPGGHIEHGESAENAVLRELLEECGATARIKRFLGCLEHSFDPGHNSICHNHEYNFIFEAESDELKKDIHIPQLEKHIKLVWIHLDHLNEYDIRPENFEKIILERLEQDAHNIFKSKMI